MAKMELQLIQRMCDHPIRITLMDIAGFNKKVEAGDAYLIHILLHAMLSYDSRRVPIYGWDLAIETIS